MAEAVLNFVVDRLGLLLVEEVKLLKNVRGEVRGIERKLERIQAFLKAADARAGAEEGDRNEGVKTWVKQVRDEAYRIEDVIDEYMIQVAQRPHHRGFVGFLRKIAHFIKICKPRHEIATEIKDIMLSLGDIERDSEVYKFSRDSGSSSGTRNLIPHDPRVGSLFINEAELVGIESTRDQLIGWLEEKSQKRVVISIVGMGGRGKTTIAKKVYDNQAVHFSCHAWVSVGQAYIKEDLLKTVMKEFCSVTKEPVPVEIDTMKEELLIRKMQEYLKEKRYLVVFDDVWKVNFWADIEHALLDNEKGSRIMLTTRKSKVAEYCKRSSYIHVHELQPLPPDKSWELFCRKAFQIDCNADCPSSLMNLSCDIVNKCGGLPLAISVIGGLLSTKPKVVSEWQKLYDSPGARLGSEPDEPDLLSLSRVLFESYHDLPYNLKSCLLYFGLFPKGYSISCVRIIRLWIAEGFVEKERRRTLEQSAGDYLTELIHRSLVQVSWVDFDGRARSCRVHDLMHDIILGKTEELGFCQALEEKDSSFIGKPRRISIHKSTDYVPENIHDSKIRSLFLFNVDNVLDSFLSTLSANFKLLKVLDFQEAPLDHLSEEVGNLFHLTYFSIRDTKVKALPKSIGRLRFLETLDLKRSLVDELPIEIKNLKNLRYILAYYFAYFDSNVDHPKGVKIQDGFGCLKALYKLYFVNGNNGVSQIKELGNLTNLRKLGIKNLTYENGKALCDSIEKMKYLESLDVSSIGRDEILDLQSMASPPQNLQRLYLKGNLKKLPDWISKLKFLTRVRLRWSGLTDDPLSVFQVLPELLELGLFDAYDVEQLHFKTGGFQKLEILNLYNVGGLKSMRIEEGALPALRELELVLSSLLKVPTGIEHLRKLERLVFRDVTDDFCKDARDNQERMGHIPTVLIGDLYYHPYAVFSDENPNASSFMCFC